MLRLQALSHLNTRQFRTIECNRLNSRPWKLVSVGFFLSLVLFVCVTNISARGQTSSKNTYELDRNEAKHYDKQRARITSQSVISEKYFEQMTRFYTSLENNLQREGQGQRLAEIVNDELLSKLHTLTYSDLYFHRYDNYADLLESGGPSANQELCLAQLRQLIKRAKVAKFERFASKDININVLLDTFGRISPGMLEGNVIWLGAYDECMRIKILLNEGESESRYCLSSFRLNEWPARDDELLDELLVVKAGVCLPNSCDSLNYKNKYQLVHKLLELNDNQLDFKSFNLTQLYCLPDKESSLRIWWRIPKTLLAVCLLTSWLAFLVYATIKHQMLKQHKFNNNNAKRKQSKFYESLSLLHNFKILISTSKEIVPQTIINENSQQTGTTKSSFEEATASERPERPEVMIVDLAPIEGVKVLIMLYILFGHVLMCGAQSVENWREYFSLGYTFKIFNMYPIYSVNAYFVITGLLTSYSLFKQNTLIKSILQPKKWVSYLVLKYIKTMPVALIVVLYVKHLSRFIGSGPLWDYGTSVLAPKKSCLQDSWLDYLLLKTNFGLRFPFCLSPSWYQANDCQFGLITPPLLALLYKRPKFCKLIIYLAIIACIVVNTMFVHNLEIDDKRPFVNVMPYSFNTGVRFFIESYMRPHYRIAAFLIGLLFGVSLDKYEKDRASWSIKQKLKNQNQLQQHQEQQNKRKMNDSKGETRFKNDNKAPNWSKWFVNYAPIGSIAILLLIMLIFPLLGHQDKFSKSTARLIMLVAVPALQVLYPLAIGTYILMATTGNGFELLNRFLALKIWKPLARLNLLIMFTNMEVILYVVGKKSRALHFDDQHFFELAIYCSILTYIVSAILYVAFEMPIKAILKHLIVGQLTASGSGGRAVVEPGGGRLMTSNKTK